MRRSVMLQRIEYDQESTRQRAKIELEVAIENQRENALQMYLDRISELLLTQNLLSSDPEDARRDIARIWTLTVLRRLDSERKSTLIRFLYDSGLIRGHKVYRGDEVMGPVIHLMNADLSGADLSEANLKGADLSEANLSGAKVTREQLAEVKSLNGATMPDGSIHP
jgi:uncharacterized protein YjbI with pentapeptide repeats